MRLSLTKTIFMCAALSLTGISSFAADADLDLPTTPPPASATDLPDPSALELPPAADLIPAPAADTTTPAPAADAVAPAPSDLAIPPAPTTTVTTPPLPGGPVDTTSVLDTLTTTTTTAVPAGGVRGKITGGRVNIRAGNNTKYEILLTANPDTEVTVFERVGDWVKIAYPESESCYISRQYISNDIPAEIPAQGALGTIRGEHVNVRARPWPGSTVVGQVSNGDSVIITGLRGQWAVVRPPQSARGWVFHKYVSYDANGVKVTEVTATDNTDTTALRDTADKIKDGMAAQNKRDQILETLKKRAEAENKQHEMFRQNTKRIMEGLEDQLARIDEQAQTDIRITYERAKQEKVDSKAIEESTIQNYRPGPPPGSMGGKASGWLSYVGYLGGRPAGYRLVKGGETQYLLRSMRYNLDEYIGRRVLVSGDVKPAPAWEADVMTVTDLRLFDNPQQEVKPVEVVREPVTSVVREPETTTVIIDDTPATTGTRRVVIDVTGLDR